MQLSTQRVDRTPKARLRQDPTNAVRFTGRGTRQDLTNAVRFTGRGTRQDLTNPGSFTDRVVCRILRSTIDQLSVLILTNKL